MRAGLDEAQLAGVGQFLLDHGETVTGELGATLIAGGRSNLTYRIHDDASAWVLRRPPRGGLTPSAHDIGREYRVNRALQRTAVPVARTIGHQPESPELGSQFSVVAYVHGQTVQTAAHLERLTDDEIEACVNSLVATLVALHGVDHVAAGLEGFGHTQGYGARQLRRWSGQWEHMNAESADADSLLRLLGERVPEQSSCSVVHGDFRVDNTILDPEDIGKVVAVVDWELSTLGDPVADVAMMCAYRHPALDVILGAPAAWTSPRLPSAPDLAGRYERLSGRSLSEWDFYLALAYYKLAVIAEGIDYRYRLGGTTGAGFSTAGDAVPVLLAAGLEVARARD